MPFQFNCRNLPPSEAGPGVVVLVWAGELGPMERDCRERVKRVHSMPENSASLVGAAGGTGVEHVRQLLGACRLRSSRGTTGRTPSTRRQPNQHGHNCHKLTIGVGRGLHAGHAAQSPPR